MTRTFMYNAVVGPRIKLGAIEQWENAVKHNGYTRAPGPLRMTIVGGFNEVHAEEMTAWEFANDHYVRVSGVVE